MSVEDNKAIVGRWFSEFWGKQAELNEAGQRLRRIAQAYLHQLTVAGPEEWDKPRGSHWTIREIAEHVGMPWYAEQVSDLTRQAAK
jgi:hypothetical protein